MSSNLATPTSNFNERPDYAGQGRKNKIARRWANDDASVNRRASQWVVNPMDGPESIG